VGLSNKEVVLFMERLTPAFRLLAFGFKTDLQSAVGLSDKEAVLFLERLAALERSGATEGSIKGPWEDAFLDLIHHLATQPPTEARPPDPELSGCWLCVQALPHSPPRHAPALRGAALAPSALSAC